MGKKKKKNELFFLCDLSICVLPHTLLKGISCGENLCLFFWGYFLPLIQNDCSKRRKGKFKESLTCTGDY